MSEDVLPFPLRAPDIAAALGVWRPLPDHKQPTTEDAGQAHELVVFVHALWRDENGRIVLAIRTISPDDATALLGELFQGDFSFLNTLKTPVAVIRYQDKPEET